MRIASLLLILWPYNFFCGFTSCVPHVPPTPPSALLSDAAVARNMWNFAKVSFLYLSQVHIFFSGIVVWHPQSLNFCSAVRERRLKRINKKFIFFFLRFLRGHRHFFQFQQTLFKKSWHRNILQTARLREYFVCTFRSITCREGTDGK